MPLIALSLSEELEKFGAYAGLAAFFGFAVLTILYFAQAREVKRLREWAGRAPERAAELEARVAADAARRAAVPARQPPPAAGTVTPGPATPAGAPAGAGAAATAATAATAAAAAPPTGAGPGNGAPATDAPPPAEPGEGKTADAAPGPAEEQVPGEKTPEPTGAPATDGPTGGESPVAAEPRPAGNGGAPAVPSIPRATPPPSRPQPAGPPPPRRPVPAASLRQPAPAVRRPGQPTARGPGGPPSDRGRSRTALAIGAGLLAAVAAVLIAVQLFGGGEDRPAPNVPTPAEPTATQGAAEPEAADGGPARGDTTVAVLNGTTVTGLAAQIADDIEGAGFIRGATANYSDQARSASLVFYEEEFRRRAQEVARIIKLPAEDIEPITDDVRSLAGEADVVVVVGADQAP